MYSSPASPGLGQAGKKCNKPEVAGSARMVPIGGEIVPAPR